MFFLAATTCTCWKYFVFTFFTFFNTISIEQNHLFMLEIEQNHIEPCWKQNRINCTCWKGPSQTLFEYHPCCPRTLAPQDIDSLFRGANVLEGANVLARANVLTGAYVLSEANVLLGANVLAGANVLRGANVKGGQYPKTVYFC